MTKTKKLKGWDKGLCHTCHYMDFNKIMFCKAFGGVEFPTCAEVRGKEDQKRKTINSKCPYWKGSTR